jgi:hypothetical protein
MITIKINNITLELIRDEYEENIYGIRRILQSKCKTTSIYVMSVLGTRDKFHLGIASPYAPLMLKTYSLFYASDFATNYDLIIFDNEKDCETHIIEFLNKFNKLQAFI